MAPALRMTRFSKRCNQFFYLSLFFSFALLLRLLFHQEPSGVWLGYGGADRTPRSPDLMVVCISSVLSSDL
ncbi:hypothetical protein F5X97DRAFT_294110 [Nemania serpens]|nr:hypothetical protein F5X97DRAFT_294110 [Nemania serpens]